MNRIKGRLLKNAPYIIGVDGQGMKVHIGALSTLKIGDRVYEEELDNGIILIIPEAIYKQED